MIIKMVVCYYLCAKIRFFDQIAKKLLRKVVKMKLIAYFCGAIAENLIYRCQNEVGYHRWRRFWSCCRNLCP